MRTAANVKETTGSVRIPHTERREFRGSLEQVILSQASKEEGATTIRKE